MRNENKKYLGVSLTVLAFSMIYNVTAIAQTCSQAPSCEELGYIDTSDKCSDNAMVKCPFDTSKVFCRSQKTKPCDTIGDILYDDKTCAIDINHLDSERTPIGVVFDISRKLAIALEQSSLKWSSTQVDIPQLKNYAGDPEKDFAGKYNTRYIVLQNYETPAAEYCYNYSTPGTKKGDWYLPAAGEAQFIYNNKETLNFILFKLGKQQLLNDDYWTSTEQNNRYAWDMSIYDGDFGHYGRKFDKANVRPIIAF